MTRETASSTQNEASVTLLSVKIGLTACTSLKSKRNCLRPLLSRIHKEFNVGVSETGLLDFWQSAWISCAIVSNDSRHNAQVANEILLMIDSSFPNVVVDEYHLEYR
jgi:uncharacterized protein YlxP (DUF503 family)